MFYCQHVVRRGDGPKEIIKQCLKGNTDLLTVELLSYVTSIIKVLKMCSFVLFSLFFFQQQQKQQKQKLLLLLLQTVITNSHDGQLNRDLAALAALFLIKDGLFSLEIVFFFLQMSFMKQFP